MTRAPLAPALPLPHRRPQRSRLPPPYVDLTVQLPPAVVSMARLRSALIGESVDEFVLESVLRRFDS